MTQQIHNNFTFEELHRLAVDRFIQTAIEKGHPHILISRAFRECDRISASQISKAISAFSSKDETSRFGYAFLSRPTDLVPLRSSPIIPNVRDAES
jgi:hypothetical protein